MISPPGPPSGTALIDHSSEVTRRPTMVDVARAAGVTAKTVSRVVNDESTVHPTTAARVRAAITTLGYRRNALARTLRRADQATASIGLIIEDVANPFYSTLTRAVEEVARQHGCHVLVGSSDEDPAREANLIAVFTSHRVDGLLIVPTAADHSFLSAEMRAGTPVVFVDRPAEGVVGDTVVVDNAGGARSAVQFLLGAGHVRIAHLGDHPGIWTAAERTRGYREAHAAAGITCDPQLLLVDLHDADSAAAATIALLTGSAPPTALFAGNNLLTIGALRGIHLINSPVTVVGFDDFALAELLNPPLTVIAQDPQALGTAAAQLLFARIAGDQLPVRRLELPTRLIIRGPHLPVATGRQMG